MPDIENVADIDLDSTLADFHGQMRKDLELLKSPEEPDIDYFSAELIPMYLERRASLIKKMPGWWRNLPRIEENFQILYLLRELGFVLNILSKGPKRSPAAWTEKVLWCQEHVPDAQVTLTMDKGLVYGKVLVDDFPDYVFRWLTWRPRGQVIMPAHPWNEKVSHPNIFHYHGQQDNQQLREILLKARDRNNV